jgi:hypothetical protein
VIASSVIFKFGKKLLTTDLQGLTHEKARPLKAYFAMMQWITKAALENGFEFIDFGPTTAGPKMDLGAFQAPMQAAGYASNPIVAFGIQRAGIKLQDTHSNKAAHSSHGQPKEPTDAIPLELTNSTSAATEQRTLSSHV